MANMKNYAVIKTKNEDKGYTETTRQLTKIILTINNEYLVKHWAVAMVTDEYHRAVDISQFLTAIPSKHQRQGFVSECRWSTW